MVSPRPKLREPAVPIHNEELVLGNVIAFMLSVPKTGRMRSIPSGVTKLFRMKRARSSKRAVASVS